MFHENRPNCKNLGKTVFHLTAVALGPPSALFPLLNPPQLLPSYVVVLYCTSI